MEKYTKLDFGLLDKVFIYLIFPLIGIIVGYFLPVIAKAIASLEWFPFQGPFALVASLEGPFLIYGTTIIGLVAGVIIIFFIHYESLIVYINCDELLFKIRDTYFKYQKDMIKAVYLDDKDIVLIGLKDNEIFRYEHSLSRKIIADSLIKNNYPYQKEDEYRDRFRVWVVDTPQLSVGANALLKARSSALKDDKDIDRDELLEELWKIGVSVKTKNKKQYYRQ